MIFSLSLIMILSKFTVVTEQVLLYVLKIIVEILV